MDSGSWWWTGRPGMLQFMGSQTVGHDWGTELNWTLRNSHFQRCEVVSHCGFYLHVLFGHLYIFFGKMFNQDLCQFLNLRCFFGCWVIEVPYIFGYIFWINLFFLSDIRFANIFSQFIHLFFTSLIVSFAGQKFLLLNCGVGEDSWESLGL